MIRLGSYIPVPESSVDGEVRLTYSNAHIITHKLKLQEVVRGLELVNSGKESIKVVLLPEWLSWAECEQSVYYSVLCISFGMCVCVCVFMCDTHGYIKLQTIF